MSARRPRARRTRQVAGYVAAFVLAGCAQSGNDASHATLEPLQLAVAPGSAQPHLATGGSDELVLSWLEPMGDASALRYSTLVDGAWRQPSTLATGTDWFVNWADFPSVVPIDDEIWAAHWLEKREGGTYAYDIAVAISRDAGGSWSRPFAPHRDGTATEHGFVTLFPADGRPAALWLDGRNTSPDDGHDHGGGGAMTLRSASFGETAAGTIPAMLDEALADERVCDCCQTDVAIAGATPVAVYRNRSETEIRDIFVTRWIDGGWTEGVPVAHDGWEIAGCPVNGPAIAATGENVAVAWFTAANNEPRVRYAVSTDGGRSFATATDVDTVDALGRVDVVLLDDRTAVVSYLKKMDAGAAAIVLRSMGSDGTAGEARTIAVTSAGRMTGFPQLARHDARLVLAWTDSEDGTTRVRSAALAIDGLPRPDM